ncbi:MAG: outer membrane protein assembly factor BamA, partial [Pontixanthobacter sp.]
ESQIRDFDADSLALRLPMKEGNDYDAKLVEDTVEQLTELAGNFGYAFADVRPQFNRNKDALTMDITFILGEAPRVYVERIDVNGNTLTQDKVLRREFRIAEGDAFNSLAIKRSTNRIKSLGFFQENFEIEQKEGSRPDRIVLEANVEEQATGELQLSAGFSSLESFILSGSIRQRNFRGRGQTVGASVNYSRFSKAFNLSFSEPYVFDRNISAGVDVYLQDFSSVGFNRNRNSDFEQSTLGGRVRAGVPLSEYLSLIGSYTLNFDNISVGREIFGPPDENGNRVCIDSIVLCDVVGKRTSSILGATLAFDNLNSRFRPTAGESVSFTTEFAGVGGDVRYLRLRGKAAKYWDVLNGFIFSVQLEGGAIKGLEDRPGVGVDDVRLNDRFQLGEPQFRGFDIRGVGPRVVRLPLIDDDGDPTTPEVPIDLDTARADNLRIVDISLGGNAYYLGRAELEIPLGSGARELGLRPSVFVDVGSLFSVTTPITQSSEGTRELDLDTSEPLFTQVTLNDAGERVSAATTAAVNSITGEANAPRFLAGTGFQEFFLGDTAKPRVTAGVGVNWNSPFGPFRIDFAQTILSQPGDDTKRFTFNVGTQF